MSYFDIALLVLIALCALVGLKRGFFKSVLSFFGWMISLVVAFFLTKIVAEALLDHVSAINKIVLGQEKSLFTWVMTWLPETADSSIIGKIFSPFFVQAHESYTIGTIGLATEHQAAGLLVTNALYSIMVGVAIFIVLRLIVGLISLFIKTMASDKKPTGFSRLLGFLVGIVKGAAYGVIAIFICFNLVAVPQLKFLKEPLEKSVVAEKVYEKTNEIAQKFFIKNDDTTLNKLAHQAGFYLGYTEPEDTTPEGDAEGDAGTDPVSSDYQTQDPTNIKVLSTNFGLDFNSVDRYLAA